MNQATYFWIYILECENGHYYTGYTKDLTKRYQQHLAGKSKYTRSFKPKLIAQCWKLYDSIGTALKIEQFIKKQTRTTKILLIEQPLELQNKIVKLLKLELNIFPLNSEELIKINLNVKKAAFTKKTAFSH